MKTVKKVMKEVEEIDDLICNMCGKSLKQIISSDGIFNFCGLEEVEMVCGYGSRNDGIVFSFSMCEDCVLELFDQFMHSPKEKHYF